MKKKPKPPAPVESVAGIPCTFWCMGCKKKITLVNYATAPRFGGGRCARGKCPVCGGQVCKALPAGEKEDA